MEDSSAPADLATLEDAIRAFTEREDQARASAFCPTGPAGVRRPRPKGEKRAASPSHQRRRREKRKSAKAARRRNR